MIKVSTKFNRVNAEDLKSDKKLLIIVGACCSGLCVFGAALGAVVVSLFCLLLLIGAAAVAGTVFYCIRSLDGLQKKSDMRPYNIIIFSDNEITISCVDASLLTPAPSVTYPLSGAVVTVSKSGNIFYLKFPSAGADRRVYQFNEAGLLEGTMLELRELLALAKN